MDFITHDHNFGLNIVESNPQLKSLWGEIVASIESISDERILQEFRTGKQKMSISDALNKLIDEELTKRNWVAQSAIFQGKEYKSQKWRLDFSKRIETPEKGITGMAVEVAFNHGEAIAWNLLKPNLAAEINQVEVQTEIGSGIGIYICATKQLKKAGGFDSAVGEYEKVLRYLFPLSQKLTKPMIIIGLQAPHSFAIKKSKNQIDKKNTGIVELI